MAHAAVNSLLENVSRLLTSYPDLISGAEDDLQRLKNVLVSLNDTFLGQGAARKTLTLSRETERQMKEVIYEAEDTVDACLTQLALAANDNMFVRHCRRRRDLVVDPKHQLVQQVRSLTENKLEPMLNKVMCSCTVTQIGDESGTSLQVEEQWTREIDQQVPSIKQARISLLDEEEKLIQYLMDETEELDVVTIVGMPGLGKTTLAWNIYNNPKVQHAFPTRIWVYISLHLDTRTLFLNILQEFTSKDMSTHNNHDLALAIRASLEMKRFLLVLDDVWTTETWDVIRDALPLNNRRGKVFVTSRSAKVCMYASHSRKPHNLRPLRDDEGWELLQLKVFGKNLTTEWPPELERIGKLITKKCHGLPILIVMIAGILIDQLSSKSQETSAVINVCTELSESLSSSDITEEIFTRVLSLSYDRLRDDELKVCFLYLGVFPEAYEIPTQTLTQLWIAEGFIRPKKGHKSLEEMAEENLNNLIQRNLMIVDKFKANGKVKTFCIHDTVREFCITEDERNENLFQEVRTHHMEADLLQNHRRLCMHFDVLDFFSSEPYVPRVRSFLSFSKEELALQTQDIPKVPGGFELIRVLHIKSIRFRIFPLQLTQLIHLKYIVLSSDFKVLPEAVFELRNTQTLIIQTSSRTLVAKDNILKMSQLRHVKTNASITLLKTNQQMMTWVLIKISKHLLTYRQEIVQSVYSSGRLP